VYYHNRERLISQQNLSLRPSRLQRLHEIDTAPESGDKLNMTTSVRREGGTVSSKLLWKLGLNISEDRRNTDSARMPRM
jgi:hypothetical protein